MRQTIGTWILAATRTCALATVTAAPLTALAGDRFSAWSAPVNLGPPVNTAGAEQFPAISKNGLSFYFSCNGCPGNLGTADIWVAQRASVNDSWGTPVNLGPNVNSTGGNANGPALSPDEHRLYFSSQRPGGFGLGDIYVSRRRDRRDDFGWEPLVNLGSGVNGPSGDAFPEIFEDDDGTATLYFQSNRPGGPGLLDIYSSTMQSDDTFGPAVLVAELSSPFNDQAPGIRKDGLEIFLASNRPDSFGDLDLWVSTRASTSEPWSTPVNLGPVVNGLFGESAPGLSRKATELYFHLPNHPGNVGGPFFDIWVTTRTKLKKQKAHCD